MCPTMPYRGGGVGLRQLSYGRANMCPTMPYSPVGVRVIYIIRIDTRVGLVLGYRLEIGLYYELGFGLGSEA